MAGIESIVRPFARPDSLSTRRIVAKRTKTAATPAVISWGKPGNIVAPHQVEAVEEPGADFRVVKFEYWREEARIARNFRIEQTLPNGTKNPDNFVDVSRPDRVKFKLDKNRSDPDAGLDPDQRSARNSTRVYADSLRDSAAMQPFTSLADRKVDRRSEYELKNDE